MSENKTVLDLFTQQLDMVGDQQAVCYQSTWLTFNEINQQSGSICRQLIHHGVEPGDRVGFIQSHNIQLPALVLGIMKAGAICVPLDPSNPMAQLKSILQRLPVKSLICQQKHIGLAQSIDARVMIADHTGISSDKISISSDIGAYVLYTSGTTGHAKAILRDHFSLISSLYECLSTAHPINLLRSSITHTSFLYELFLPLVTGTKLVIAPRSANHNPVELRMLLNRHQITYASLSPAHLRLLVSSKEIEKLDSIKFIDTSGEILPKKLIKTVFEKTNIELVSSYGCTEVPAVAFHKYTSLDESVDYIGQIRQSMELRLLDSELNSVDDGDIGEIYLSGPRMALSYINDEAESRNRFVSIDEQVGEQIVSKVFFRTGDLGRRLDNGEYEYLGRIDRQVQINGFRVELLEVETMLRHLPYIRDAYVTYSELPSGMSVLVAYLLSEDYAHEINQKDLRIELLELLPDYKVPKLFIQMDSFPMNHHHKVDPTQLPSPGIALINRRVDETMVLTPTEKLVSSIWSRFLDVSHLQPTDDFFLVGGDSFSAISMLNAIKDDLQFDLGLDLFLDATTLSAFSKLIENDRYA